MSQLRALPQLDPEKEQALWEKYMLEWNYNSTHIEGNTLTYAQAKLLILLNEVGKGKPYGVL